MDPSSSSSTPASSACGQGPFTILEFSELVSSAFAITNDLSFSVPVASFPTAPATHAASPPSSPPNPPLQPSPPSRPLSLTPTFPTVSPPKNSPTFPQTHAHFTSQSLSVPNRPWQRSRPTFHFFSSPAKPNSHPKHMFDRIKKHASALVGYHPSPSTSRDDPARSPSPTTEHFYPIPTISLLSSAKLSVSSLSHEGGDDDGVDSDFIPYLPLAVQYERAFPYSFTRAPDASTTSLLLAQRLGSSPTRSLRSLRTRSVGPGSLSGNTTARSLGLSRSWSSDSSGISASSSSSRDSLDSASTATDLNSPLTPRSPHFFAGGSDSNPPSAHSGSSVPTPREGSQTRFPAISDAGASDHDEEHNSEVDSKVDDRTASLDQDPFAKGSVQIVNHYYQQSSTRRHPYASPALVFPYHSSSDSKPNASSTKHHRHYHNTQHNHTNNTNPNSKKRANQPPSPPPRGPLPQLPTSCSPASTSSCSSDESTSCIDGGVPATASAALVSSSTSKSSTPAEHWTLGLSAGKALPSLRECENRLSAGKASTPSSHTFPASPDCPSIPHTSTATTSTKHLSSPPMHTSMLSPHIPTSPSRSPSRKGQSARSMSPIVTEPILPAHEQKPVHRICSSSALLSGSGSCSEGERDAVGFSTTEEWDTTCRVSGDASRSRRPSLIASPNVTADWTLSLPLIQMRIPEMTATAQDKGKSRGRCQSERLDGVKKKHREKRRSAAAPDVIVSDNQKTKERARSISPVNHYTSPLLSSPIRDIPATAPTTPILSSPARSIGAPIRINTDLGSTPRKSVPAPAPLQCTPLSRPPRIDTRKVAFADVPPLTASSCSSNNRPPSFITASRLFLENYRHYEGPMTRRRKIFLKIRREQERGEGKVGVVESAMEEHGSSSRSRTRVARLPSGLGMGDGSVVGTIEVDGNSESEAERVKEREREVVRQRAPWEIEMKKGEFILQPVPRVFLDGVNKLRRQAEDEDEDVPSEEDMVDDADEVDIQVETVDANEDRVAKAEAEHWVLSSPADEASLMTPISNYRMPMDQFPLPPPLTFFTQVGGPIPHVNSNSSDNVSSGQSQGTFSSSDVDPSERRGAAAAEDAESSVIRTAESIESLRVRKRMSSTLSSYVNVGDLERACAVLASYRKLEGRVSEEEQVVVPREVSRVEGRVEQETKDSQEGSDHDSGCDVASLKSRGTITLSRRISTTTSSPRVKTPLRRRRRMVGAWVDDDDEDLDDDEDEEEGAARRERYSLHTEEESAAFYSARSSLSWALGA